MGNRYRRAHLNFLHFVVDNITGELFIAIHHLFGQRVLEVIVILFFKVKKSLNRRKKCNGKRRVALRDTIWIGKIQADAGEIIPVSKVFSLFHELSRVERVRGKDIVVCNAKILWVAP